MSKYYFHQVSNQKGTLFEVDMLNSTAMTSMKSLATDVRGGIVPLSGHWIPEEQPDFLVKQLAAFFSE
jgi:hypothetical protein